MTVYEPLTEEEQNTVASFIKNNKNLIKYYSSKYQSPLYEREDCTQQVYLGICQAVVASRKYHFMAPKDFKFFCCNIIKKRLVDMHHLSRKWNSNQEYSIRNDTLSEKLPDSPIKIIPKFRILLLNNFIKHVYRNSGNNLTDECDLLYEVLSKLNFSDRKFFVKYVFSTHKSNPSKFQRLREKLKKCLKKL